jgi:hypothetical protein
MTSSHSFSVMVVKDLSLRIPAFATKTCTPPNFSRAALTITSPSSADAIAAAAFPPAMNTVSNVSPHKQARKPTLCNFVNHSVGALFAYIVDNDVGTKPRKHMRIHTSQPSAGTGDDHSFAVEPHLRLRLGVRRQPLRLLQVTLNAIEYRKRAG